MMGIHGHVRASKPVLDLAIRMRQDWLPITQSPTLNVMGPSFLLLAQCVSLCPNSLQWTMQRYTKFWEHFALYA